MSLLDRRLNPLYAIKECSSCGKLHTKDCGCSKGSLEDKILVSLYLLALHDPLNLKKLSRNLWRPGYEEQAAKDRIGIPVATLMRGLYHCIDPYYHKEPTIIDSNNDSSSSDDDSYENINYVDDHFRAEIVSLRAFYDNHIEEKSSGSTITHADFSQYDSFIFDISIKPFSLPRGVDFYLEEFADETRSIISLLEYDHFCFKT
ncbi:hypothetical protein Tco_0717275 [Tanacetum coccineum]